MVPISKIRIRVNAGIKTGKRIVFGTAGFFCTMMIFFEGKRCDKKTGKERSNEAVVVFLLN